MSSGDAELAPRASELSKVPSWILLGFVVGALFVGLLKRQYLVQSAPEPAPVVAAPVLTSPSPAVRAGEPSLSSVEAIWSFWGTHAVWVDDVTQVAIWNSETLSFADSFEVIRRGESYYFRSLPGGLSRPVLDRGLGASAPIQFTGPPVISPRRP